MASIQCTVDIPEIPSVEDANLTVGREFFLVCRGEWPKNLVQEQLKFDEAAGLKYKLKLLGFEFRSTDEADLKVTSYLAGEHSFPNLILSDGTQKVELGPVHFAVQSVLPKDEKVEPYGPMGPAVISVPILYWLILFGTLILAGTVVALRVWRFNQRRLLIESLTQHDSALSPLQEFHQSMRRLQRASPVFYQKQASKEEIKNNVAELSRMFKVFLSRRLRIPAFHWGEGLILKDLRRYHPAVHEAYARKIQDLIREFKKAEAAPDKLHDKDVVQLSESLRKTMEGIERVISEEARGEKTL